MGLEGFANLTAEALASITGAGLRTARRWRSNGRAPAWALRLLVILVRGDLGSIHPAWDGWRLAQDVLHSPEGTGFSPGEVKSIPLRLQQISALERDARSARASSPRPAPPPRPRLLLKNIPREKPERGADAERRPVDARDAARRRNDLLNRRAARIETDRRGECDGLSHPR